ncbi:amidohydrolase family protein [Sandaracinobacter sp. RS1-74]|uniref:amidohydrolase family protein n=1 Tax=Sandaracinobacteroides sayramensis TaxID=2913411 RepID=UPI001EDAB46B|nr:amidohydrolase family protein [Sandaracinobacteroides sayramensis]MCG2841946.1 amidohydrolase family protein [Sandaracinobacteroides sayramensis]
MKKLLGALLIGLSAPALAQAAEKPKWDVMTAGGAKLSQVAIDVNEGSWLDLDVSPDGRSIAFALLGDIYTLPIGGGTATRIAEGLAWEVQPRFSPDGRRIAFTSDRGGGDNIWVMNADGSDKRQVTKEDFRLLYQPDWSPDGQFIAAKKHFTTQRSLGTGEIWLYHVSGGGGQLLVKRASEQAQKELGEPAFSPDGRRIYYTRNVSPGPIFEYAQDSNTALFAVEAVDIATGEISTVISAPGGAVRPTPSPDGRSIAFIRRERTASSLFVRDLASGRETRLVADLDRDMQETWAVTGVYPNIAWTPDSRSIVFWGNGKLKRVDVTGANLREIPFRVTDSRDVVAPLHPEIEVSPDRFTTKMARFASVSPDGRTLAFESLGKLWLKPAPGGAARRLTSGNDHARELFPAWSRDGRSLAYVRWTDSGLGQIHVTGPGGGAGKTLVSAPGHYGRLAFSPDGKTLAFEIRRGGGLTSSSGAGEPGVWRVATAGGTPVRVATGVTAPHFGAENDRLFANGSASGKQTLVSMDLNGEARRTHASGEMATDFRAAPDGRLFAFRQNYEAHVMPLLPGPQDVPADARTSAMPVVRASRNGADWLDWSADGRRLGWSMGPSYYQVDSAALFQSGPTRKEAAGFTPPTSGVSLAMEVSADKPGGTVALTGARILTMAGADGGVIENGTLLVRGDRILAVGPAASVAIPAGATRIDATGKTIMPGLVDAHAHGPFGTGTELIPEQNWVQMQALALGTTTIHDPSSRASEVFAAKEYQQAGKLLAPRIFSTGEIVYGAKSARVFAEVNALDDALAHARRLKAQGALSIKNYNQPRREQRQQVIEAGRRERMQVVAEGGSLFGLGITHIVDGNATFEHNLPVERFYEDVMQLWTGSKVNYTPTLVVSFGGLGADPYWRAHTDIFEQPLLKAHTPPGVLAESIRRPIAPDDQYFERIAAREAKRLADKGILVSIGAHGQQPGIAAHWELWSFVRGGMSPLQALQAGTIVPARSLGMAKDIGSLEPGKLADLILLDANPLDDIRNSEKVAQVMLGGRLYDAATLDELAPTARKRPDHWWADGQGEGGAGLGWSAGEANTHGH